MSGSDELDLIVEQLVERLDEVLNHFGIDYIEHPDRFALACPIHDSDNEQSLNIYINGHTTAGNWKCWTQECESELVLDTQKNGDVLERARGKNIFGFIRGVIGARDDRNVGYGEAIRWAKKFLNFKDDVEEERDEDYWSKKEFVKNNRVLLKQRKKSTGLINRKQIRDKLNIPAQYFAGRGFKKETLDRYDVGFCNSKNTQMYQRVVVPVYDDNYKTMIGCVGRTIQPLCNICNKFHYLNRGCPSNQLEKYWASKWINSKGFNSESTLYNLWFAKKHIQDCGVAILVEGQGDVWRLEEADIHIGLGLFGSSLTDDQKLILNSSGAMTLLILTDGDKAGLEAREKILLKCKRYYNCMFIDLPKKDIGDMDVEQVKQFLGPVLEKVL